MQAANAAPILERLLKVTIASRAVFAHSARAVESRGFAALFAQRVDDESRMAAYLREQLAVNAHSGVLAFVARDEPISGHIAVSTDPSVLLGRCLHMLDTSIREFSQAYAPVIPVSTRIRLTRHQHQTGWAREELFNLQRACEVRHYSHR